MMNTNLFTSLITVISALNDTQGAQLLAIANGYANLSAPVVSELKLHIEEETKKDEVVIEGEEFWTEDFCQVRKVDKEYRLYITCPVQGEKGESIRYAIKKNAKENYGVKWAGDYKAKKIYWAFPTKKSAEQFRADRKERAKKEEA